MPDSPKTFFQRSDLWWALATPVYYFVGLFRHEGSHAAVAVLLGGRISEFSLLPAPDGSFGHVKVEGGNPEWIWTAAPYVCDMVAFVIGYFWLRRIPPDRRPLLINVFVVLVLSPLIDLASNYRGFFRRLGPNDIRYLAQEFGSARIHAIFIPLLAFCLFGFIRALRFRRGDDE